MDRNWMVTVVSKYLKLSLVILCLSGCGGSGGASSAKQELSNTAHNTSSQPSLIFPSSPVAVTLDSSQHLAAPLTSNFVAFDNPFTSPTDIKKIAYDVLYSMVNETCISGCGGSSIVTISGAVTFDFVPIGNQNGLDFANVVPHPARGLLVEILDDKNTIIATTQTSAVGSYLVKVPANTLVKVRVKAQMQSKSSPNWDVKVTDNTNKYAVYALDGELRDSGASNSIRNLHAPEKLTYYHGVDDRSASPFNIIDTTYKLFDRMVNEASVSNLPSLEFRWNPKNRPVSGDESLGEIGGSAFYNPDNRTISLTGNATTDMHEFDVHVISHEVGHYFTYALFRGSNGLGAGAHNEYFINDLRIAFDEGIATAYAGILLDDPDWRQVSFVDVKPTSTYHGGGIGCGTCFPNNGAYTEGNAFYIVYTYFNKTKSSFVKPLESFFKLFFDKGFMSSAVFPSIYLFASQVEKLYPAQFVDLQPLLNQQNIFGRGELGAGETFAAGLPFMLPHYPIIQPNQAPVQVCTTSYYYTSTASMGSFGVHRTLLLKITNAGNYSVKVVKNGGDENSVVPHLAIFQASQYKYWLYSNIANGVDLSTWGGLPPYFNVGDYTIDIEGNTNTDFVGKNIKSCFDVSVTPL